MTVEQLIEKLKQIENKKKNVAVKVKYYEKGYSESVAITNIKDGNPFVEIVIEI